MIEKDTMEGQINSEVAECKRAVTLDDESSIKFPESQKGEAGKLI